MKRILFGFSVAYFVVLVTNLNNISIVQQQLEQEGETRKSTTRLLSQPTLLRTSNQLSIQNNDNAENFVETAADGDTILKILEDETNVHSSVIAGLDCSKYGGPSDPSEMVYWRDIPRDAEYTISPHISPKEERFVTFEPDEGGFNNIRMALETVIALAIAMGRTLVLPPAQGMYLLNDGIKNASSLSFQKSTFSFTDFYPLEAVARESKGTLKLMSMKEFLEKQQDLFINHRTTTNEQQPSRPNRTDWNGASNTELEELKQWLRQIGVTPSSWQTTKCVVLFADDDQLQETATLIMKERRMLTPSKSHNKAAPVNATVPVRLTEFIQHRSEVCAHTLLQNEKVIHFTGDIESGTRLLIHFYAFLFFSNWKNDLWMKRFARDKLRYVDEIQCAAARIVKELRLRSATNDFDTFHIRRGDFKVKKVLFDANEIYASIEDVMTINSTIYIATDERNRSFFEPFYQRGHTVYFLDDFSHLIQGLNTNFYGLVDQLILARGHVFVGCMYSTFTGFVTRLRGYYSTRDRLEGYQAGALPTTYHYAPKRSKTAMHKYQFFTKPINAREFPVAWRDIDFDAEWKLRENRSLYSRKP